MLQITKQYLGNVTILQIAGRIDSISAGQLQATVEDALEATSPLILNLNGVDYMSAAGLRVLRLIHDKQGSVTITEPSARVRDVMQITGLDATYKMYDAIPQALQQTTIITNAHTHLELGWLRDGLPPLTGTDFVQWMAETIARRVYNEPDKLDTLFRESAEAGVQALVDAGTTRVGDISSRGHSIPALNNARMNGIVYLEVIGASPTTAQRNWQRALSLIEQWRSKLHGGLQLGLEFHAPYTVHRDLWQRGLEYAAKEALPICIHVAQSPAETDFMRDGSGAYAQYEDNLPQPLGHSPVKFLEVIGALQHKPLLIHAVQVDDADIDLIKQYDCRVVHCPRSNIRLRCGRMPLEKFLEREIPVFLGTDSLVSAPSLNVLDEAEYAIALHHGKVPPQDVVKLIHAQL